MYMGLKKKIGTIAFAMTIIASTLVSIPVKYVEAESSQSTKNSILAKIAETKATKKFGYYNEAYAMILQLPESEQGYYFGLLAVYAKDVYTPSNLKIIDSIISFSKDANLGDYEDLVVDISAEITDPIDQGYFLGELTAWGRALVYTSDATTAIDSIVSVYKNKTYSSLAIAETAIKNVEIEKSKEWLTQQLAEAASVIVEEFVVVSIE
jgi:hypothetical protein